ncbi:MAG TPA: diguanylate cyclase [Polyangiaceae bacterium]
MKVLIADDDRVSLALLSETVRAMGHEIVTASHGAQALELLADETIQLALLDWTMPRIDGIDVCTKVRAQKRSHELYLILVSARTKPESVLEGLDAGADDYVAKPFSAIEIVARVRAAERALQYQKEVATVRAYIDEIVANLDCGVMLSDPSGRILFANDALARLAGIPSACSGKLREEVLAVHSCQAAESERGSEFLKAMMHAVLDAKVELAVASPEPRVVAWSSKLVHLGATDGRLDLCRDVSAEADLARKLAEQARHDHLTGLLNRRGGEEAIRREVERAKQHGAPISFLLADVDRFKDVNDRFGHAVGDRVLEAVARCVRQCLRAYDHAVRWGGEEILVVLPETRGFEAAIVAEKIRIAVAQVVLEGAPQATISIGLAELGPQGIAAALESADEALYAAKQSGRNCTRRLGDERATMVPSRERGASLSPAWTTTIKSA